MNKKFYQIVKDYSYVLVDSYGVIKFADGLNQEALKVLRELRLMGKTIIMLSNATFTDPDDRYGKKGVLKGYHYDAFITSGMYAQKDIRRGELPLGSKYVVFGTANFKKPEEKVPSLFEGSSYEYVRYPQNANFVYCGIPQVQGEDRETMDDFIKELLFYISLGLPLLCTNPDEIGQEDGRFVVRQGTIVKLYREFGGRVILYGKPDPRIFDFALGAIPRDKVLMIGDTLGTDILGANRAGIKSCLTIAGGVTEKRMLDKGMKIDVESIDTFIKDSESGTPDFIIEKIF